MVHQPPILILDEPTAGVDVELRNNLWENVKNSIKRDDDYTYYTLFDRGTRNV